MNINNSVSVNAQAAVPRQKEVENSLGKDAFLKILVTQMKNQNPLEPLKDTEFIGQMAQFSSLEQLTNLNQTMTQFVGGQESNSLSDHADLIGKKILWEQEAGGKMESGEGIVKAVSFKNGEMVVEIGGTGVKVPINMIQRIEEYADQKNEQELV